jgi:Phage integrase, N-terminal SAM-like domain
VDNDAGAKAKNITLQEQRAVDGLDHHVPIILRDGRIYNGDLDRFLLDLPLNGVRSRHSLGAYGYDVMVWVRFLEQARSKGVWEAERDDVTAFHGLAVARRLGSRFGRVMEPVRSRA